MQRNILPFFSVADESFLRVRLRPFHVLLVIPSAEHDRRLLMAFFLEERTSVDLHCEWLRHYVELKNVFAVAELVLPPSRASCQTLFTGEKPLEEVPIVELA